jgi:hypothetical protein
MAILGKYIKQPAETMDYDISFAEYFNDGDTLVAVGTPPVPNPLSVTVSPAGLTFGPTFVLGGTTIKQWVSGGVNGVSYKITITATSNAGRVKQVEFVVKVKDE